MKTIFVFGSNMRGIHGAGAAKFAKLHHNAVPGVGEGLTGTAYALPTKIAPRVNMSLYGVRQSIKRFLGYAKRRPDLNFQVTQVGCGLAGFTKEQIVSIFMEYEIPKNCYFDRAWKPLLPGVANYWGTI